MFRDVITTIKISITGEKKNRLHINMFYREIIQDYSQQGFLYVLITDSTKYLHHNFS